MRRIIMSVLMSFAVTLFAAASLSAPALAQKTYKNDDLASDGIRLEAQVKQDGADLADKPVTELRKSLQDALLKKDTTAALHFIAGLIAVNSQDWLGWMAYSEQMIQTGKTDEIQRNATTAAYLAYHYAKAKPDEAKLA
jgi:hypothetical protein